MEQPIHDERPLHDAAREDELASDCESVVSRGQKFNEASVRDAEAIDFVRRRFVTAMDSLGLRPQVVAIRKNPYSTVMAPARVQSFQIFASAVARLRGGIANVKHVWFGASSIEEIADIVTNGFGHAHGPCLRLSPDDFPLESVKNSIVDKDGLRHLLLCRVILGRSEVVPANSQQCRPSTEEYDSGVDSVVCPSEYIICSNRMNTHILPEYVLSFRLPFFKGHVKDGEPSTPSTPWVPFPELIVALSKILPPPNIALISKFEEDYKERKISRHELTRRVRLIAGDKLLFGVLKAYRAKKIRESLTQTR